ncbi:hypothetical protein CapIbe_017508 [Capra ibex]
MVRTVLLGLAICSLWWGAGGKEINKPGRTNIKPSGLRSPVTPPHFQALTAHFKGPPQGGNELLPPCPPHSGTST